MFQTTVAVKIKTQFYFQCIFPENRAVYEIMEKNAVQAERPEKAI
jgi:hypothetical protein